MTAPSDSSAAVSTSAPQDSPQTLPAVASSSSHLLALGSRTGARDTALVVIMVILLVVALTMGKALIMPVVVAIPLYFLFAPAVRWLSERGIPRFLGALLVMGLAASVIGGGAYQLAGPARAWMERFPATLTKVEQKLHSLRRHMEQMDNAAKQVEAITASDQTSPAPIIVSQPSSLALKVMSNTGEALAEIVLITLTVFFLLSSGGSFLERLVALIPGLRTGHDTSILSLGAHPPGDSAMILRECEHLVGMFMRTTILLNALLAMVLSTAFWIIGMPNPVLWGVFAGVMNFMPYVGPVVGVPVVGLVSLASFDSLPLALLAPLIYAAAAFIGGNLLVPLILGRQLALSPIAIFLWMALWGWMWGAAGALIAVPMLVLAKIVCSRSERLQHLTRLMDP